jgi:transcription antitermination factor NusG
VIVAQRLEQSIDAMVYAPRARMPSPSTLEPITISLYAGHFFTDLDHGPPWQAIRRQVGVISLVMTGNTPSRCPESEILKLQAAEIDGLVQLAGQPPLNGHRFTIGDRVKIGRGALEGRDGVYDGPSNKRDAIVMVALLGRRVPVRISVGALAPCA